MDKSIFFSEEYKNVLEADFIDWQRLRNQTILVTGATGLIGTCLIKSLDYVDRELNLGIRIIAIVRNLERAKEKFSYVINSGRLKLIEAQVEELPQIEETIDYIIHGASQTASKEIVEHAVETINTAVLGTNNLLLLAREKEVKGFVYLSSMEIYGNPPKGHMVKEDEIGALSPLDIRNSYPISKLMCESMCYAYAKEYGVSAMICRLTQTIGTDVNYNDTRLFAYFANCVREKNNIVLKTKGESERSYLLVTDAVNAILTIMLKGEPGVAYNASDEEIYGSISEMAEMIATRGGVKVEYDIQDVSVNGFPKDTYVNLDTTKLKKLGWRVMRDV